MTIKSTIVLVAMMVALSLGACTDTPGVGGGGEDDDCPEGESYDPIEEQCVEGGQPNQTTPDCDDGEVYDPAIGGCVDSGEECDDDEFYSSRLGECLDPWGDESGDGIPNRYDNCPGHDNPDQTDTSGDGVGDACDNCPELANPDQAYSEDNPVDDRGIIMGDACVPGNIYVDDVTDTSGDGVPDVMDLCPEDYNPPLVPGCECPTSDPYCEACLCQCPDSHYPCNDGCELGDGECEGGSVVCEQVDTSGDGVGDECDNCPGVYNPMQEDSNGDGFGDACAPTPTGIEICETQDTEFEVLEPNVYIMLDISGSMNWGVNGGTNPPAGQSRWELARPGLIDMAQDLADEVRFGLGTFPVMGGGCVPGFGERLSMGSHPASTLVSEFNSLSMGGGTPMYRGIDIIHDQDLFSDPGDPLDDQRIKTVLMVTDGEPNCDPYNASGQQAVNNVVSRIGDLADDGIPTYVLGFAHNTDSLEAYAQAGMTDEHYLADDADSLSQAIGEVAELLIGCSYALDATPPNPDQLWFSYDGNYVDAEDISYDTGENVLTLSDAACDEVRSFDADNLEIEIEMGCAAQCVPEEPQGLCDVWYESCGEEICEPCGPEICDGQDNNCSGEVDENCPDCGIYEAPCESTDDCCEPFICDGGTCGHACYPVGVACRDNDDCCTGQCAINSGEDLGQCIPG